MLKKFFYITKNRHHRSCVGNYKSITTYLLNQYLMIFKITEVRPLRTGQRRLLSKKCWARFLILPWDFS
jgi:hypothetical protein